MNLTDMAKSLSLSFLPENLTEFSEMCQKDPKQALEWALSNEIKELNVKRFERRLKSSTLGSFRRMEDFDWLWPKEIDRPLIETLLEGEYARAKENVILIAPEGLGKTMIAKNLALVAITQGMRAKFVNASTLVNDLGSNPPGAAKSRTLTKYTSPHVLIIDEIGYVNYNQDAATDLFEVVSRRYEAASTIVTTNLAFKDWSTFLPHAACASSLVDRLIHHSHEVVIKGDSYRLKEHRELQMGRVRDEK